MAAPEQPADPLDAWMDGLRRGGEGALPPDHRLSLRERLAAVPWAWLLFPLLAFLAWRGMLRVALALGFSAAPLLALALISADAWRFGRRARRRRAARG